MGAQVVPMADDGMDSLRFTYADQVGMEREVTSENYADADGIAVEVSVHVDKRGRLFELDVWRVDSGPLRRFPEPSPFVRG